MPTSALPTQCEDDTYDPQDAFLEVYTWEPLGHPEPPVPAPLLHKDARSLQRWLDLSA